MECRPYCSGQPESLRYRVSTRTLDVSRADNASRGKLRHTRRVYVKHSARQVLTASSCITLCCRELMMITHLMKDHTAFCYNAYRVIPQCLRYFLVIQILHAAWSFDLVVQSNKYKCSSSNTSSSLYKISRSGMPCPIKDSPDQRLRLGRQRRTPYSPCPVLSREKNPFHRVGHFQRKPTRYVALSLWKEERPCGHGWERQSLHGLF